MQRTDEQRSNPTPEKRPDQGQLAPSSWYATCTYGHIAWIGDDRPTEAEAKADADAHDAAKHGGTKRAAVLPN